ncbi:NAD(P)-dependent oxidoreductase [Azospirillum doebereinerae]
MQQDYKKIAFVGLGQMGLPMAKHLAAAGLAVAGFDLAAASRDAFRAAGGQAVDTVRAAVLGADVVITMLPTGKVVQSALLDNPEVAAGALPNAVLLEMSSSAPNDTRALRERLPAGMRLVDAPVSGGVKRAVTGSLTIMAGGAAEDIDRVQPLLDLMGQVTYRCGPVGAGHAMKAINNFVSGAGVIAAVEGIRLGQAFGLEPSTIVDVINASSGKNNATDVKMKQFILSGSFASGFALGLMAKDIRTAADLSRELGLSQPCLNQTARTWDDAAAKLGGAVDHTRIAEYLTGQDEA